MLPVELAWDGPIDGTRRLSLRLIAEDGTLVAQVDDGLDTLNKILMFVPPDAVPGPYGLHLMVYDSDSLEPIPTADGQQIVQVATVQVGGGRGYRAVSSEGPERGHVGEPRLARGRARYHTSANQGSDSRPSVLPR